MITIQGLNKKFGSHQVLKDLNLNIPKGQATGIVGPNGSGKTTTIKAILGLVKPDTGQILIDDDLIHNKWYYRRNIGYMPQNARYPENMTVNELFNFIEDIREEKAPNKEQLIRHFKMDEELKKRMRTLSGGTRQKAGAILSMMFDPELLIFDEPTAGLDPRSSILFKRLLKDRKEEGKTILLTTHIMSEIEELADYLVFLVEGEVRYHGPMDELIRQHKEQHLEGAVAKLMEEVAA